jgi:hypothetical protein
MRGSRRAPLLVITLMAVLVAFTTPALTQEKSADTMELLRQKMKADKKLVVGANLELEDRQPSRKHENGIGLVLNTTMDRGSPLGWEEIFYALGCLAVWHATLPGLSQGDSPLPRRRSGGLSAQSRGAYAGWP